MSARTISIRFLVAFFALLAVASVPFTAFAEDPPVTPTPPVTENPPPTGQPSESPSPTLTPEQQAALYLKCQGGGNAVATAEMLGDPDCRALAGDQISSAANAAGTIFNCAISGNLGLNCLINGIAYLILQFANLLLALSGTLFNWVVVRTVFQFATFLGNSPGLLIAWGILRDIGNMLLLFGFIFIGLSTILNLDTYAAKKALPRLLIFAILMNFSLFAAEAVVDTSNILSTVMYRQANTDTDCNYDAPAGNPGGSVDTAQSTLRSTDANTNCFLNNGIAGRLMRATGADSGLFGGNAGEITSLQNAVALLMLAAFATVTAVVLFAGSIMLIIRAVTLSLLMVGAPLGFAGMAVPAFRKMGEDWWNRLLHQSFFAPIYLLLIFVSLKISEGFAGNASSSLAAAVQQVNPSTMGIILVFTLMIGFLVASLVAAKKFGAMGAAGAISVLGRMQKSATRAATFVPRMTARTAVNRAGQGIQAANTRLRSTRGGRIVGGALAVGTLGALSDYNVQKTGKKLEEQKFGTSTNLVEKRKFASQRRSELGVDLETAIRSGDEAEVRRIVSGMSTAELAKNRYVRNGDPTVMRNIEQNRFDDMLRHEDFPVSRRSQATQARTGAIVANFTNAAPVTTAPGVPVPPSLHPRAAPGTPMSQGEQAIRGLSGDRAANLPDAVLSQPDVYENLSLRQLVAIYRSGKISPATAATIGRYLAPGLLVAGLGNPDFTAYFNNLLLSDQAAVRSFWSL